MSNQHCISSKEKEKNRNQDEVESAIQQIEGRKEISLFGITNHKLLVYGLALQNSNTQVIELSIVGDQGSLNHDANGHNEDATRFFHFVQTSTTLEKVICKNLRSHIFLQQFLKVVAANANIKSVEISGIPTSHVMISLLLQESKSLKILEIWGEDINGNSLEWTSQAGDDLSYAFCQNKSLEQLILLDWDFHQTPFRIFAEAIKKSSTSLKSLGFQQCHFDASSSKELLELVVYQNQSNVQELEFKSYCRFPNEDLTSFCLKVIKLRAPTARLQKLSVWSPRVDVRKLLQPFQKRRVVVEPLLKCIELVYLHDDNFDQLVLNLPTMSGIDELRLSCSERYNSVKLLDAMRRNHSLKSFQEVKWNLEKKRRETIMNTSFRLLSERNETIQKWRELPHHIPQKYLYRILVTCLAYEFHIEIVFDLLKKKWALLEI